MGSQKSVFSKIQNQLSQLPLPELPDALSKPLKRLTEGPLKETLFLRAFGITKVPVLFFLSPSVVELTDQRCVVKIPLTQRSSNHLGSMYFGALAAGADCAGGLMAMRLIQKNPESKISLVFKDFHAEFLKRAEGDTHFICEQGQEIAALVEAARSTGERQNLKVNVVATVPGLGNAGLSGQDEPVARFTLTLSLKSKAS